MPATCAVYNCGSEGERVLPLLAGGEVRIEYVTCVDHDVAIRGGEEYLIEDRGRSGREILMGNDLPPKLKSITTSGLGNSSVLYLNLVLRNGEEGQVAVTVTPEDLELLGNPISKESMFEPTPIAEQ